MSKEPFPSPRTDENTGHAMALGDYETLSSLAGGEAAFLDSVTQPSWQGCESCIYSGPTQRGRSDLTGVDKLAEEHSD